MSHPNPQHDRSNEYPEDKVTHYPRRVSISERMGVINAKTKALKRLMEKTGGKYAGKGYANTSAVRAHNGKEMSLSDRSKMYGAKLERTSGQVPSAYLGRLKAKSPSDKAYWKRMDRE